MGTMSSFFFFFFYKKPLQHDRCKCNVALFLHHEYDAREGCAYMGDEGVMVRRMFIYSISNGNMIPYLVLLPFDIDTFVFMYMSSHTHWLESIDDCNTFEVDIFG